jgi:hypothetical protein
MLASNNHTMTHGDKKVKDNIAKYGCHVLHIAEEGDLPPFSYSVGITQQTGAPEVVVIGLKSDIAHFVVNEYNRRVRAGERFEPGKLYAGFLEGFEVLAQPVPRDAYDEYFGQNLRFYDGPNFEVLQLVYPTTDGVWPWSAEASEYFRNRQPILSPGGRG